VVVESVTRSNWKLLNDVLGSIHAGKTYDAAKRHLDNDNETLYVLCLLASWGAFESFVEEMTKAKIRAKPELTSDPAFAKAPLKAEGLDELERLERVIEMVIQNQKGRLDPKGNGKYEQQLRLAGLEGTVPPDLAVTLMETQQVRNVWAHNGGKADAKLIEQCPHMDVSLAEMVVKTKQRLAKYILAQNTYATIIWNRSRLTLGLPPVECYDNNHNMFKASFDKLFPTAVPPQSLLQVLNEERNAGTTHSTGDDPSP
jgi:hypothetical protein